MVGAPFLGPPGMGMGSFNTSARHDSTIQSDNNQQNDNILSHDSTSETGNARTCDDINETFSNDSNDSNDDDNWGLADQTNFDDVWEDPLKGGPDPRAAADFPQNALEVVAKDGTAKPGREAFGAKSNTSRNTYLPTGPDRPHKRSRHANEDNESANTITLEIWTMVVEDNCLLYNADPPVEKKQLLARLFNMSYADVDAVFMKHREGRHAMGPPPTPTIQINSGMVVDDERRSRQPKSRSKDPDSFTTAGSSSQYARSEADQTMTSISSNDSGIYHCTKPGCPRAFHTQSLWERHETDVHWNQFKWMCLLCAIAHSNGVFSCRHCKAQPPSLAACIEHVLYCDTARRSVRFLYKREVDLTNHLKKNHSNERERVRSIQRIQPCKTWSFPWNSDWQKDCIFCFKTFTTWNERRDHYIQLHFGPLKKISKSQTPSQKQIGFQPNSQNTQPG